MVGGFPTLQTPNLILRKPNASDSDAYFDLLSLPEVTEHTNLPDNATRKRCEKIMAWMSGLFEKGKGCAWIIEDKRSSTALGAIRINNINKGSRYGDIGYELHPAAWGCGYMTEALTQVVDAGHDAFELNRLEAWTVPGNLASESVLKKAGFQLEGTFRQKEFYKGIFHDLRMYGRLASDRRAHELTK